MTLRWSAAGGTDVGRVRQGNEDALRLDPEHGVFLVADGMGGHAAGEVASALAADAVAGALAEAVSRGADVEAVLTASFHAAHEAIVRHAERDPATGGMGTTLTAVVIRADGTLRAGHIGDSRMYLLRDGRLRQVTRDHTWVQREVDAGRLTPTAARKHHLAHILTRALGAGPPETPDVLHGTVVPGDRLLLATDGLTGMLQDRVIQAFLQERRPPDALVRMLLAAGNRRGGRDNLTAIVIDIE